MVRSLDARTKDADTLAELGEGRLRLALLFVLLSLGIGVCDYYLPENLIGYWGLTLFIAVLQVYRGCVAYRQSCVVEE